MPEYTPEKLPVVSSDTVLSYMRELTREGPEGNISLMNRMYETFKKDNPELMNYTETIDKILQDMGVSREISWQVVGFMTGMYEIMRKQAEANQLEDTLQ